MILIALYISFILIRFQTFKKQMKIAIPHENSHPSVPALNKQMRECEHGERNCNIICPVPEKCGAEREWPCTHCHNQQMFDSPEHELVRHYLLPE